MRTGEHSTRRKPGPNLGRAGRPLPARLEFEKQVLQEFSYLHLRMGRIQGWLLGLVAIFLVGLGLGILGTILLFDVVRFIT